MTVAEWIKLWDSINISTIPFIYYYNSNKIMKHKLYDIHNNIQSIKLKCTYENLTEYHINIYHESLNTSEFTLTENEFYDKLHLEIPEDSHTIVLYMYIN